MEEKNVIVQEKNEDGIQASLKEKGISLLDYAKSITVDSQTDYEQAAQILIDIKTKVKSVKDYWSVPKANAKAAHQTICDREKEMLSPLSEAESIIKAQMNKYNAAVEKARREAEELAKKKRAEEAERLLKQSLEAEENGNEQDAMVSLAMAQMVDEMDTTDVIAKPTASGISTKKTWKARIVNPELVPSYFGGIEIREIKASALNSIAKMTNGTAKIDGVEFYEDITMSVRT